jgi:hypothetical protein
LSVHDGLDKIVRDPPPLTVRKEVANRRFGTLALCGVRHLIRYNWHYLPVTGNSFGVNGLFRERSPGLVPVGANSPDLTRLRAKHQIFAPESHLPTSFPLQCEV